MRPYYEDGAVTLYLGDCREILPKLEAVDHVITDPPYARDVYVRMGHGGKDARHKSAAIVRMAAGDIGNIDAMLTPVSAQIARLTRRWAVVFSDVETTHRWRDALESEGMRYVRTGAWVKPDAMPQMSGDRPGVGFEPCTICHAKGAMRWNGGGSLATWTHFTAKGNSRPDHPCPKPEPLMVELVQQFTDPGDLILDPYSGSGTTLIAAKRCSRRAIGIEIDERFAEVAARRLSQGALELGFSNPDAVGRVSSDRARAADLFSGSE